MVHSPGRSSWVKFHVPSAWVTAVRTKSTAGAARENWMVTVWPAMSVVPVIVGNSPLVEPELIVTTGSTVSTVKTWVNEPATPPSITEATIVYSPSVSTPSPSRVRFHAPSEGTG